MSAMSAPTATRPGPTSTWASATALDEQKLRRAAGRFQRQTEGCRQSRTGRAAETDHARRNPDQGQGSDEGPRRRDSRADQAELRSRPPRQGPGQARSARASRLSRSRSWSGRSSTASIRRSRSRRTGCPSLTIQLGMARTARFDRCRTCHAGDRPGGGGERSQSSRSGIPGTTNVSEWVLQNKFPHPYATHPRVPIST